MPGNGLILVLPISISQEVVNKYFYLHTYIPLCFQGFTGSRHHVDSEDGPSYLHKSTHQPNELLTHGQQAGITILIGHGVRRLSTLST